MSDYVFAYGGQSGNVTCHRCGLGYPSGNVHYCPTAPGGSVPTQQPYRFTPGVPSAGLVGVPVEELDAIETHGGFGDWRCRACFEPLDSDTEDGRTLLQVVSELVAHLAVCDG